MIVTLTPSEIMQAAMSGVMRQVENIRDKRRDAHNGNGALSDWQIHIEGCLGELALAKFLGIYWSGKGRLRAPDVGEVDVRTAAGENHRLILHTEDDDDRVFWLLCGRNGTYAIKGWIKGEDGKNPEYWQDPKTGRPAFFVPQSALNQPQQFTPAGIAK